MSDPTHQPAAPTPPLTAAPQTSVSGNLAGKLSFEPEEDPADRKMRLHKELVLFWFSLIVLSCVLLACGYALVFTSMSSDDKRSVFSVITLILGGVVGYFLKR